jgi:hypothetical protein
VKWTDLARLAAFAGLDALVHAYLVGDGTATGTDCTSDEGSGSASEKASNNCTACRWAYNDLGSSVVLMVMGGLGGDGSAMTLGRGWLGDCRHGCGEQDGQRKWKSKTGKQFCEFHLLILIPATQGWMQEFASVRRELPDLFIPLLVRTWFGAFARSRRALANAFLRDLHRVRHFLGSRTWKRPIQTRNIDATLPQFGLHGGVHRGEQLVAQFVQDSIDVQIGQVG